MKGISRVLIDKRSEIAVRIIQACWDLWLESVVTVSETSRFSLPARMAGRAVIPAKGAFDQLRAPVF